MIKKARELYGKNIINKDRILSKIGRTLTVDRKIQIRKRAEDSRAITLVVTRGTSYDANVMKQLVRQGGKIDNFFEVKMSFWKF